MLIFAINATFTLKNDIETKRRCRTNTSRCTHLTRYQGNKALSWAVIPKPDSWQQVARSCSRRSLQGNRTAGRAEYPEAGGECGKGNNRSFQGSVQRSRRSVGKTFRVVSRARTVVKKVGSGATPFFIVWNQLIMNQRPSPRRTRRQENKKFFARRPQIYFFPALIPTKDNYYILV